MREIPGVARASGEAIVRFVRHQKFGRVGSAEEDGSSGAEALDDGRGLRGNLVGAEKRAGGVGPAGDVEATFDGDRNAVERAERSAARELLGGRFCG